jgi:hypothetical protein
MNIRIHLSEFKSAEQISEYMATLKKGSVSRAPPWILGAFLGKKNKIVKNKISIRML